MQVRENQVAAVIVDAAYRIHRGVGPGLFESVYTMLMTHELAKRGLSIEREKAVPLVYDGIRFHIGFRLDLLVEDCVIVELKSVEKLASVHRAQVLTYLRLTGKRLGLLINFGSEMIRDGVARVVNGLPE